METHLNPKLPTWDGDWSQWTTYKLQVELEADGTSNKDLSKLGPKLVRNLTSKAWDSCIEVDREKLRSENGVTYLLQHLESKRGRLKVDMIGDALSAYFRKGEVTRREGESWADFEIRHGHYIREIAKALKEMSAGEVPSEVFGWFVLNHYAGLEPSDVATVKSVAQTYKLEDINATMRKLWSGDSLAQKDQEKKRAKNASRAMMNEPNPCEEETVFLGQDDPSLDFDESSEKDWTVLFEEACDALVDQPNDPEVLANFKEVRRMKYTEARKALDKSRTSRGFYPNKRFSNDTGRPRNSGFQKEQCVRCGKMGHRAQDCRQRGGMSSSSTSQGREPPAKIGFVGWNALEPENDQSESPLLLEEDLDHHFGDTTASVANPTYVVTSQTDEPSVLSVDEPSFVGASLQDQARNKAIIDCGASESIVGSFMLQDFRDELIDLGFDANVEMSIDRGVQKSFLFGNDQSSNALGMAKFTAGICGQEQVIEAHVVDGGTPMLLSSKWLYDQEAVINFKTGRALFPKISSQQVQLERSSTFHLMLPLNAFGGQTEIVEGLFVKPDVPDPQIEQLSDNKPFTTEGKSE